MNARRSPAQRRTAVAAALLLAMIATGAARADEPNAASSAGGVGPTLPGRPIRSRVDEPSGATQLQGRLDALIAAGGADCEAAYQSYKAQAWLNFAAYAVQNDAPSAVRAAALQNAGDIVNGLEGHSAASMQAVELPQSRHVRDDLWRAVKAIKGDGRWCAAPKMTAYCEVQLAWAGYEAGAGGWRHVDPYVRIAEDYCVSASNAGPLPVAPLVGAVTPAAAEAAPATAEAESKSLPITPAENAAERIDVSVYVLFPHDRARRTDILSPGRSELAHLAAHLKTLPKDTLITVTGHADITGRVHYNEVLSERRASSVALELKMQGVDPARIRVGAVGSAEPVVTCPRARSRADERHYFKCLEPNRRVVIQLVGEAQ
jgi:outer membrane protein OmpA-like peptidoglycan-associated protein